MGAGRGKKGSYAKEEAEIGSTSTLEPDPRYSECASHICRPGRRMRDVILGTLIVILLTAVVAGIFVACFFFIPGSPGAVSSEQKGGPIETEINLNDMKDVGFSDPTRYDVPPELAKINEEISIEYDLSLAKKPFIERNKGDRLPLPNGTPRLFGNDQLESLLDFGTDLMSTGTKSNEETGIQVLPPPPNRDADSIPELSFPDFGISDAEDRSILDTFLTSNPKGQSIRKRPIFLEPERDHIPASGNDESLGELDIMHAESPEIVEDFGKVIKEGEDHTEKSSSTQAMQLEPEKPTLSPKIEEHVPETVIPKESCLPLELLECANVVEWRTKVFPNLIGDFSSIDLNSSLPHFQYLISTKCSSRIQDYACAILEPSCDMQKKALPPCRTFCRSVSQTCKEFVLQDEKLKTIFECEKYPDSEDPARCYSPRGECAAQEHQCYRTKMCIAKSLVCDGAPDCSDRSDEYSCSLKGLSRDITVRRIKPPARASETSLPPLSFFATHADTSSLNTRNELPVRPNIPRESVGTEIKEYLDYPYEGEYPALEKDYVEGGVQLVANNGGRRSDLSGRENQGVTVKAPAGAVTTALQGDENLLICTHDKFLCDDGSDCLSMVQVCDGTQHCFDNSDEQNCSSVGGNCPQGEFKCGSTDFCIPQKWVCDGVGDCSDSSDELNCRDINTFDVKPALDKKADTYNAFPNRDISRGPDADPHPILADIPRPPFVPGSPDLIGSPAAAFPSYDGSGNALRPAPIQQSRIRDKFSSSAKDSLERLEVLGTLGQFPLPGGNMERVYLPGGDVVGHVLNSDFSEEKKPPEDNGSENLRIKVPMKKESSASQASQESQGTPNSSESSDKERPPWIPKRDNPVRKLRRRPRPPVTYKQPIAHPVDVSSEDGSPQREKNDKSRTQGLLQNREELKEKLDALKGPRLPYYESFRTGERKDRPLSLKPRRRSELSPSEPSEHGNLKKVITSEGPKDVVSSTTMQTMTESVHSDLQPNYDYGDEYPEKSNQNQQAAYYPHEPAQEEHAPNFDYNYDTPEESYLSPQFPTNIREDAVVRDLDYSDHYSSGHVFANGPHRQVTYRERVPHIYSSLHTQGKRR